MFAPQFDGDQGDNFQRQAAEFVRSQFTALENLKQQQKRDQRLANFLQEQENNPACRRLQLKDMLPAGFQRLSKVSTNSLLSTRKPAELEYEEKKGSFYSHFLHFLFVVLSYSSYSCSVIVFP